MRNKELRALQVAQLVERLDQLNQELFNLRFQLAAYKNPSPARFRQVKKEIARIKTIQRERELENLAAR
jgi:large subunit ribosomal protein L29